MRAISFKNKPLLMGILNITPDSFYDGNRYMEEDALKKRIDELIRHKVDIIDIGGESSRPGAEPVPEEEELRRVGSALFYIDTQRYAVSVDTYKSKVAEYALKKGAIMVNDISGMRFDKDMVNVVKEFQSYIVIMHMKGKPKDMQKNPEYNDVVSEIRDFFEERIDFALSHGIKKEKIILDPGIGFGKKQEHNIEILKNIEKFKALGFPILIGHSRKSLIGYLTEKESPSERLWGTLAVSSYLTLKNIDILRVHDIEPHKDLLNALKPFQTIDN